MRPRKPVHHHRLSLLGWVCPVAARCGFRSIVVAGANGRVVGGHATRRVGWHKAVHVVAGDTEEPLRVGRTMTHDASILRLIKIYFPAMNIFDKLHSVLF